MRAPKAASSTSSGGRRARAARAQTRARPASPQDAAASARVSTARMAAPWLCRCARGRAAGRTTSTAPSASCEGVLGPRPAEMRRGPRSSPGVLGCPAPRCRGDSTMALGVGQHEGVVAPAAVPEVPVHEQAPGPGVGQQKALVVAQVDPRVAVGGRLERLAGESHAVDPLLGMLPEHQHGGQRNLLARRIRRPRPGRTGRTNLVGRHPSRRKRSAIGQPPSRSGLRSGSRHSGAVSRLGRLATCGARLACLATPGDSTGSATASVLAGRHARGAAHVQPAPETEPGDVGTPGLETGFLVRQNIRLLGPAPGCGDEPRSPG